MTLLFLPVFNHPAIIFDFNKKSDIKEWRVVDDIVMGGKSNGVFRLHPDGYGVLEGNISLENSGGFSSVRYRFDKIKVKPSDKISFRVRGSNSKFQIRVKENIRTEYSYIAEFTTSDSWQQIDIVLNTMYPSYRGSKLDMPNFEYNQIEEITFLIGNKKAEKFLLMIDTIEIH